MTLTVKLASNAASDGTAYLDSPVNGRITAIRYSLSLVAGAGGVGRWTVEVSRSASNQVGVNNARGVLSYATAVTAAASQGGASNPVHVGMSEAIKAGERLYLNCASAANFSSGNADVCIDIA